MIDKLSITVAQVILLIALCIGSGTSSVSDDGKPGCRTRYEFTRLWRHSTVNENFWECTNWREATPRQCPKQTQFHEWWQTCVPAQMWDETPFRSPPTSAYDDEDACEPLEFEPQCPLEPGPTEPTPEEPTTEEPSTDTTPDEPESTTDNPVTEPSTNSSPEEPESTTENPVTEPSTNSSPEEPESTTENPVTEPSTNSSPEEPESTTENPVTEPSTNSSPEEPESTTENPVTEPSTNSSPEEPESTTDNPVTEPSTNSSPEEPESTTENPVTEPSTNSSPEEPESTTENPVTEPSTDSSPEVSESTPENPSTEPEETTPPNTESPTVPTTQSPFMKCPGADDTHMIEGSLNCARPTCTNDLYQSRMRLPAVDPGQYYTCLTPTVLRVNTCLEPKHCFSYALQECVEPERWFNPCGAV
ncbi:uncharacterized protein LOC132263344 [Phlebotomus argentipes]|uniref:uncharacterized protein LOC132263344 n=1 Tax=Phlebotomus argentipes TaxID=94469 RepID=UPI002893514C|nr:uncharacterized protein LOC132263344 [Phlebotomus argentipes]